MTGCFAVARISLRVRIMHVYRLLFVRAFVLVRPLRPFTVASCAMALMTILLRNFFSSYVFSVGLQLMRSVNLCVVGQPEIFGHVNFSNYQLPTKIYCFRASNFYQSLTLVVMRVTLAYDDRVGIVQSFSKRHQGYKKMKVCLKKFSNYELFLCIHFYKKVSGAKISQTLISNTRFDTRI